MASIKIHFPRKMTSATFTTDILCQLPELHHARSAERIIFDFSETESFDSDVITKIIALGLYYRKESGRKPFLFIPWKPTLLSQLDDMNLFKWLEKSGDFDWSKEYIGGYNAQKQVKSELHVFKTTEDYFDAFDSGRTMLPSFSYIFDYSKKYENFSKTHLERLTVVRKFFEELIQNSIGHGGSPCVIYVEENKFRRIISISDLGVGLNNTLSKKNILANTVEPKSDFDRNLISLVNALFFRMGEKFGLYDVADDIAQEHLYSEKNPARMRMYNGNCYMLVNYTNFQKNRESPTNFYKSLELNRKSNSAPGREIFQKSKELNGNMIGFNLDIICPLQNIKSETR